MKFLSAIIYLIPLAAAIWPIPTEYVHGASVLWINANVKITYSAPSAQSTYGMNSPGSGSSSSLLSTRIVETAVQRTYRTIFSQNFVPWKFHPRNSNFEPPTNTPRILVKSISLQQTKMDPSNTFKPLDGEINESYTLNLTTDGLVSVVAESSIGIARALTTLTQLFYAHSCGGTYTNYAPVSISDTPKFSHRGLNLDVSRSFYPVSDILRTIDALAYNKFNRLHLHITDSQSWPLVIPSMPALAAKGAYRSDLVYNPNELQEIQYYGAILGVEVFLEIDMPGHTASIWYAYPELIAAFNQQPNWGAVAAEPPSGTLKLNSSAVYNFLNMLFDDLLPRVSPYTSYFNTGGDEVNFNAYLLDETVHSNSLAVLRPLLQIFIDNVHARVRAAGLIPIVWEEMLLSYNLTLGSDVIVQSWLSEQSVAQIVSAGHKALVGNYNYWYLDCGQGQWLDFEPGVASSTYWPYADYCSPRKNWRLVYSYDPLGGVPANLTHLVLGGEVSMWSEQTDPVNLDRQLWPRASAAGEVLWSGAKDSQGHNRSQIEASPRLSEMRERLVARAVMAEPIQMPFCTMNGSQCAIYNNLV